MCMTSLCHVMMNVYVRRTFQDQLNRNSFPVIAIYISHFLVLFSQHRGPHALYQSAMIYIATPFRHRPLSLTDQSPQSLYQYHCDASPSSHARADTAPPHPLHQPTLCQGDYPKRPYRSKSCTSTTRQPPHPSPTIPSKQKRQHTFNPQL